MIDDFFPVLREVVAELADTMLFIQIEPGEEGMEPCDLAVNHSSIVGFSGALRGSLRLAGPDSTVLKLAGALLGDVPEKLDADASDAFAELANMIGGGVKNHLESRLGPIRMSPPVVISGEGHGVTREKDFACLSHQFKLDGELFFVETFISEEEPDKAALAEETASSDHWNNGSAEDISDTIEKALAPGIREVIRESTSETVGELVREALPRVAEGLVREEIERIKREGDDGLSEASLAKAVESAFTPQVTEIAQTTAREMTRDLLPGIAEKLVQDEIRRIKVEAG
ncbi:MAG: chemotaxis protein CheX [Magnetococcales bacterium]|nr:chemotaxis protein CheX [Magnetococcales bacterium]